MTSSSKYQKEMGCTPTSERLHFRWSWILIIAALLVPSAEAKPNLKRIGLKVAVAGIAAGMGAYGLHHCRASGVEKCDGKYGAAWAIFGVNTGFNFLMIPLSEKIGGAGGNVTGYAGPAVQFGHGVFEYRKGTNAKNVDLSSVVIVHR